MAAAFGGASSEAPQISASDVGKLHAKIGRPVIEWDFYRQLPLSFSAPEAKTVKQDPPCLSVRRHFSLLSPARPGLSCQPRGEGAENLTFMGIIDRRLETPWLMERVRGPVTCSARGITADDIGSAG